MFVCGYLLDNLADTTWQMSLTYSTVQYQAKVCPVGKALLGDCAISDLRQPPRKRGVSCTLCKISHPTIR